jgi:nucleotide-binding universal stress UspA family protein
MSAPQPKDPQTVPDRRGLTVVVGIDDSVGCWRALSYAVGLCGRQGPGGHLVLVHVDPQNGGGESCNPEVVVYRQEAIDRLRQALHARLSAELVGLDLTCELRSRFGGWPRQLDAAAHSVHADVIVVAARARVGRWYRRRLASAIIAASSRPVIAVP